MKAAADILAQAPGLYDIQIGSNYTNGYYFNMTTEEVVVDETQDDVSVLVYNTTTTKTHDDFCKVTIGPCLFDDSTDPPTTGLCAKDKWCGDEPTPTKNNYWS